MLYILTHNQNKHPPAYLQRPTDMQNECFQNYPVAVRYFTYFEDSNMMPRICKVIFVELLFRGDPILPMILRVSVSLRLWDSDTPAPFGGIGFSRIIMIRYSHQIVSKKLTCIMS